MLNALSAAVSSATGYAVNIGSKVKQLAVKRSNKSKLILNPEMATSPILIHCFIEDIDSGVNHQEGKGYKIPYVLNRVIIKNTGRIAAEYCEGFIVKEDNTRERLTWSGGSERVRIQIFPASTKELDVCAMLYLNPIEFNRINQTFYDANRLLSLVNQLGIPELISPTQSGIQSPPSLNRPIRAASYLVEVNYKSPDILKIPILINSKMDDLGIFVTLRT